MFQKKNEKALENLKPEELVAHQKELMVRKAELLQRKKDGVIADEEQAELDDLAVYLVAVSKLIKTPAEKPAEKSNDQKPAEPVKAYIPPKGEENIAVLKLTRGRRFNPDTGVREAPVFTQKFNASEYRLFMEHYKGLGYTIEEVIYNPF